VNPWIFPGVFCCCQAFFRESNEIGTVFVILNQLLIKLPTIKTANKVNEVDKYIAGFPEATQYLLHTIRTTIKKAAPAAEEVISYQMPAYKYNGMLVFFAGYKNHIGFYPGAAGIEAFKKDISSYKNAKGSVQFPLDKPLPLKLITKIVKFRVQQNKEKAALKIKKKK